MSSLSKDTRNGNRRRPIPVNVTFSFGSLEIFPLEFATTRTFSTRRYTRRQFLHFRLFNVIFFLPARARRTRKGELFPASQLFYYRNTLRPNEKACSSCVSLLRTSYRKPSLIYRAHEPFNRKVTNLTFATRIATFARVRYSLNYTCKYTAKFPIRFLVQRASLVLEFE